MTPHDSFDSCLDAFARAVGASLPERAGGDPVVLSFDGIAVSFLDDASGGAIVLHAGIGEALGGSEGAVAREMLAANAALRERQGPILGQDPETKAFGAIRSIPLPVAEPDVLLEAVGDLVKTAASWRERLGTAPDAANPPA